MNDATTQRARRQPPWLRRTINPVLWGGCAYLFLQIAAIRGFLVLLLLGFPAGTVSAAESLGSHLQNAAVPCGFATAIILGIMSLGLPHQGPTSQSLSLPIATAAALLLAYFETRLLALPLLAAALGLGARLAHGGKGRRLTCVTWLTFVLLSLSPIDLTLVQYPGPPRFVRATGGAPSRRALQEAPERNLFFLGEDGGGLAHWLWVW